MTAIAILQFSPVPAYFCNIDKGLYKVKCHIRAQHAPPLGHKGLNTTLTPTSAMSMAHLSPS